jgi:pyrroloquinoline quinone (PQQ) biosynthesis protein C
MEAHAREEASHVALWDAFACAAGGDIMREPAPETAACAQAWAGEPDRPLLRALVALYAIEAAQPEISATKRAGLLEHYGFADGPATEYFSLHAELDREHAAHQRELIAHRLDDGDHDDLLAEAERVLRANWELLDGVERLNGRA